MYLFSKAKRNCLSTVDLQSHFCVTENETIKLRSRAERIMQTVNQWTEFSFGFIRFFLENITLLWLQFLKFEQPNCIKFSVRDIASTCYSMLGLGDVESDFVNKNVYISFLQKILWYFSVKRITFAQTGKLLFDRYQLLLFSIFCEIFPSVV